MPIFHTLTLFLGMAFAASPVDQAAGLLSRYPAGGVPGTPHVLEAITTLSELGGPGEMALLESLAAHEQDPVRLAAVQALNGLGDKRRSQLRRRYAAQVPRSDDIRRWLTQHRDRLFLLHGNTIGPLEQRDVAYAALVLSRPIRIDPEADLHRQATALENQADAAGALRLYATAAGSGDREAMRHIEAFGVDAERLVLGMLKAPDESPSPEHGLETLVANGTQHTVRILMERSSRGKPLNRAIALDALSRMLASGRLSAATERTARRHLHTVTQHDPETDVRILARTALSELDTD